MSKTILVHHGLV